MVWLVWSKSYLKVIVILVMLLHCTDLEDERRPSVVNSPSLDSTGEEQLLQTDESSGNHCCVICATN